MSPLIEPTVEDRRIVQSRWDEDKCLRVNAIVSGDGQVTLLRFLDQTLTGVRQVTVSVAERMPVTEYIRTHVARAEDLEEIWTDMVTSCEAQSPDRKIRVRGGESNWGSNGYLAVSTQPDDKLLWVAFFEDSNPFVEVKFDDLGNVLAATSLRDIYQFPIVSPDRLHVVSTGQADDWRREGPALGEQIAG